MDRVAEVHDVLRRIFDEAEAREVVPLAASESLAAERLAAGAECSALV